MRKMIDGNKVQNWHRELRAHEPSVAFLRRHALSNQIVLDDYRADLREQEQVAQEAAMQFRDYYDEDWDYASQYDLETYEDWNWLRRLCCDFYSGQLNNYKPLIPETIFPSGSRSSGKLVSIEERLFDHLSIVKCKNANLDELDLAFSKSRFQLGPISKRLIDKCCTEAQILLLISQPFWLRSLDTFTGKFVGHHELFNHVFDQHFIDRNPFFDFKISPRYDHMDSREIRLKWMIWGIVFSYQGNLSRAGKVFGWRVHSKLQYHVERLLSGALDPVLGQDTTDWY